MNSCFSVGNTGLIALILHFYSAGFSAPVANNQTPVVRGFVTAPMSWRGREWPERSPGIVLTILARWPQEGGSCEVINREWLSDNSGLGGINFDLFRPFCRRLELTI
jgi:hypothetical protein